MSLGRSVEFAGLRLLAQQRATQVYELMLKAELETRPGRLLGNLSGVQSGTRADL